MWQAGCAIYLAAAVHTDGHIVVVLTAYEPEAVRLHLVVVSSGEAQRHIRIVIGQDRRYE
jgi:hypothetical protein